MAGTTFAIGFLVFGTIYSFGVLFAPLMRDLGSSRSETLALYAISSSVFYFFGPATGWVSDRFGPRIVSIVGALVMTAGLSATAFVDSIWMAYLTYGAGLGVGAACIYIPALASIGRLVPPVAYAGPQHRGRRNWMRHAGTATVHRDTHREYRMAVRSLDCRGPMRVCTCDCRCPC